MTLINFKNKSLKVIALFVPLTFIFNNLTFSQSDSTIQVPVNLTEPDSLTETTNSYFYFDLSFTNNNINSNEFKDETLPASLLDLSFYHKSGLWTGVLPVSYFNTSGFSFDLDFCIGYQKFISNYFDVNLYYTNHNFSGDSTVQGVDYSHAINLSLGLDITWLYLFAEGYANFGASDNYFTDFGFTLYKDYDNIFSHDDYISVMPMFSTTFGTDYWYYDNFTDRRTALVEYYLERNGYKTQNFGFLSIDLILMVSYNYKNLGIGATYNYNIPGDKFKKLDWSNQSGIMLSINYLLNLK